MFSSFIVWYLFFAGMGSGAFVIAALTATLSHRREVNQTAFDVRRVSPVTLGASSRPDLLGSISSVERGVLATSTERVRCTAGFIVAALSMVLAALLLLCDFGDPLRTWRVILTPFASIVSFGANAVILFTAITILTALLALFQTRLPRLLSLGTLVLGTLLALATMVYAGLFLAGMVSVDVWRTWLIPLLFVVSSFSCGLAAVLFLEALYRGRGAPGFKACWTSQLVLGLVEAAVLAAFLVERLGFSPTARASIELLLTGEQAVAFWGGVIGIGLLIPLTSHLLLNWIPIDALILAASACVIVGGFLVRYCVVGIGLLSPIVPLS
jgi:formate-dependent nitrite reductase membrane component NrfD